jgi:hypothetical protein
MSDYHRRLPHRTAIFLTWRLFGIIHFQERAAAGIAEDLRRFREVIKKSALRLAAFFSRLLDCSWA